MTMTQDERLSADALGALRARFDAQSRKAQHYYAVMHEARRVYGTDEAASSWMEAPLAAFGNQTPAQLVVAGREQEVLEHVRGLKPAR
jgi:uncharacterized protein (DUF2384 family)